MRSLNSIFNLKNFDSIAVLIHMKLLSNVQQKESWVSRVVSEATVAIESHRIHKAFLANVDEMPLRWWRAPGHTWVLRAGPTTLHAPDEPRLKLGVIKDCTNFQEPFPPSQEPPALSKVSV